VNPLKLLPLAALSLFAPPEAPQVVVLSRGDARIVGAAAAPADAGGARFLAAAEKAFAGTAAFDAEFPLVNPPAWGRVVSPDAGGRLAIRRSYPQGLLFQLEVGHLQPGHAYVLCINGRPDHPGNGLLPESVPGNPAEKYYDFCTVTTDSRGAYRGSFALRLAPGAYNVHFYIKDTTDHKIILYGVEYFAFTAT
jgi:hypothetical protein